MQVTIDSADVRRVFQQLPGASIAELNRLIRASAIDVQRDMRIAANVGATGDLRRAIKVRTTTSSLSAEIYPDVPYAEAVEMGTRPHWTSVRPGTPLEKWARFKGINPFAVRASIAKKGTKAHPFVRPTFERAQASVPRDISAGFSRFVEAVDGGRV